MQFLTRIPTFVSGMKKSTSFLLLLFFTFSQTYAQQILITETTTVKPVVGGEYTLSGVTPNGKSFLVTKPHYMGLYLINISDGKIRTVTDLPGTGYDPAFSKRGKFLCYRSDDYTDKKRYSTLYKMKLRSADTTVLVRKERVVSCPHIAGNDIVYTIDGKLQNKRFYWWLFTHADEKTFVLPENLTPVLWKHGYRKELKPGGEGSYIWISLSPDGKKMLYYLVGKGAFVCDLNGRILLDAGNLMNPGWLNNDYIIGVGIRGNVAKSTSTDLVAYSVKTSKRIVITNTADINERNPYPFDKGRKIAYQTPSGSIQVININIK
jgi:Tol biopolymer transport system component